MAKEIYLTRYSNMAEIFKAVIVADDKEEALKLFGFQHKAINRETATCVKIGSTNSKNSEIILFKIL